MHCRHTVPDWHRHVEEVSAPIFVACRLLVAKTGGVPAADPRSIACEYWGRQTACPLYDGPAVVARPASPPMAHGVASLPSDPDRARGARERRRRAIIGLAFVVAGLLVAGLIGAIGLWKG